MTTSQQEEARIARIDAVVASLRQRLPAAEAAGVEAFARLYFAQVSVEDISERDVDSLTGAVLSLWRFAAERAPDTAKIRVFTPRLQEHGWSSPHSIIEIINDDMPFLVSSVAGAVAQADLAVHLMIHPIVPVARDKAGRLTAVDGPGAKAESMMHVEVDERTDRADLDALAKAIERSLRDVRWAVDDWKPMMAKLKEAREELASGKGQIPEDEVAEATSFLGWLGDDNFTFLGVRDYAFEGRGKTEDLVPVEGTSLGVLRDESLRLLRRGAKADAFSREILDYVKSPAPLIVTKTNTRSTVHRTVHMDYIGVKRLDADGKVIGERRFVGLFTSVAYNRSVRDIPYLARKVQQVLALSGVSPQGHDGKALLNILETYPRDDLFQVSVDEVMDVALGVLRLGERPRVKLFARRDRFGRFVSVLAYVPREKFNTELRTGIGELVAEAWGGEVETTQIQYGDGPLARVSYLVRTPAGEIPDPPISDLEDRIRDMSRGWADMLLDALKEAKGEEQGNRLWRNWAKAFSAAYREAFDARAALYDIDTIGALPNTQGLGLAFYRRVEDAPSTVRFKLTREGGPLALSDILPLLENLGFRVVSERPYAIEPTGGTLVHMHDFLLEEPAGHAIDLPTLKPLLEEAVRAVWTGLAENDRFNKLIINPGLDVRHVRLVRAYARYLRQAGLPYGQSYIEATVARHPQLVHALVRLFELRFKTGGDPASQREAASVETARNLERALEAIASLDEDRIFRRLLNVITSTLRTNFYQTGAQAIAFKIDSQRIIDLPLPRPMVEIWVASPRVEGVHLRFGKVARGGLRWSDRPEDFRTEVLGLVKAQQVKNAVIVPVGSKGGFFPKRLRAGGTREEIQEEGIAAYKIFVGSLLDITDSILPDGIRKPKEVVCWDGDDPYLVVAADKGTATFSDIANGLSIERDFWLGDAFASGGSAGYDHKKMGITAKGAWEAVKRHFREQGRDIQTTPFTVVGVGDMSGDVFGNGMLLSPQTKLIAAFDHRHIFLDPDPNPETSFKERERMFNLPRSSWEDYDAKLISAGGGIYPRSAKSIPLSEPIKALTGLAGDSASPTDLMRALLRAPADLLWFGGIGTYVKASTETDADVNDRANDPIRVNGREIRAKVVGEGANLGCTQRGRIEFAKTGGRINTDAIDNSAGVDCSDHEVNIKILLGAVLAHGEMTLKQRDRLLADMTDDVSRHVLKHNYLQTGALTATQRRGVEAFPHQQRLMRMLERDGRLDRAIEYLPNDDEIAERIANGEGLVRPEIAVVMAYAKNALFADLIASHLPDEPAFEMDLFGYFPERLREPYASFIREHRLRREIIATVISSAVIDRGGPTFVSGVMEEASVPAHDAVRAFAIVRDAFDLGSLWNGIDALDLKVDADVQLHMHLDVREFVRRLAQWVLRNIAPDQSIAETVARLKPGIASITAKLPQILEGRQAAETLDRAAKLTSAGVPETLAVQVSSLPALVSAPDIVLLAEAYHRGVEEVARIYHLVGTHLKLDGLRVAANGIRASGHWDRLALRAMIDDLYTHQKAVARAVLSRPGTLGSESVLAWLEENRAGIERTQRVVDEIESSGDIGLAQLAVAGRQFRALTLA